MKIETLSGPNFWLVELPKAIDRQLAGVPQELTLPEEFEVQAPINLATVRTTLLEMVEEYREDLQGIEVYGVKVVDRIQKGLGRQFNIDAFKRQVAAVETVEDVAKVVVKIASFYAPDYGKVGHPCHPWCKDWGRCPNIQRPAITSLIQHFCTSYGATAEG